MKKIFSLISIFLVIFFQQCYAEIFIPVYYQEKNKPKVCYFYRLGGLAFYSISREKPQKKPFSFNPQKAQIIIRIHNESGKSINTYVVPKFGDFIHKSNPIDKSNKKYSIQVKNNYYADIYIVAEKSKINFSGQADGAIYIGGRRQEDSCYFRVRFTHNHDDSLSDLFCEKNFVMQQCYKVYNISFYYKENIMDITVYNKKSTQYTNDGAC